MIVFLRFLGIINAAVWFGASVFYLTAVHPSFSSAELERLLTPAYAGAAGHVLMSRFYMLHHVCGVIALIHLMAEWLYMGRPMERLKLWLVLGVFALGLAGGLLLQPRLEVLHIAREHAATPEQQAQAARSYRFWRPVTTTVNIVITLTLLGYLWRNAAANGTTPRFGGTPRMAGNIFRG